MSQSIKRDGWYFRSFGYIKRKLSILALYYFPSFRTLGPGNRKAVLIPIPGMGDYVLKTPVGQLHDSL